ncbi:MAG TPA: M20/M25/M40 family metallo-hydrolase [Kofleriaceae bacterium]|nr:M20/M25/M40 family metallo-hydrolase [Kofleriaceae bacterium]
MTRAAAAGRFAIACAFAFASAGLAGCAGDDGGADDDDGGGDDGDGGGIDAVDAMLPDGDGGGGTCVSPVAEPPWLAAYLAGHVQQLAAAPRATVAQRNAARAYVSGQLASLGLAPMTATYSGGANVVAELPATTASTAWLVVGAHFDTVTGSPGANDNATGVAIVLAAARALAAQSCRDTNVAFVFFDQEEIGLVGSQAYASAAANAGRNIVAAHTIDQAGWDMDDDLRFEIERPSTGLFAQYQAAATAVGAQVVQTSTNTTDHESFRAEGFAAAGLTEEYVSGDTTPHYHMATDTTATVDTAYHRVAARLMIVLLARELGAP